MFLLDIDEPAAELPQLLRAIESAIRKWISLPQAPAAVSGAELLPKLDSLSIDVSGGQIDPAVAMPFHKPGGSTQPGPSVADFRISGHPIRVAAVPVEFDLQASGALFAYAPDNSGKKLIALLQHADHGNVSVHLNQGDLDSAALDISRKLAGDHITVQKVNVGLTSISPTEVDVLLTITAKKFVTAIIRVSAHVSVDDKMTARATDLVASGDGMVGKVAVGIIQPQLNKLTGMPLPLLAFSLGSVKVKTVEIDTGNGLSISASFGSDGP